MGKLRRKNGMSKETFDRETIDLIAYMLTSARGLPDEPAAYGPFRLLEGVSRLCGILIAEQHSHAEELKELKEKIDKRKFVLMTDEKAFIELLDETVLDITHVLMDHDK
jgi:hypothetical protein